MDKRTAREISLQRAEELRSRIADFQEARKEVPTGFALEEQIAENRRRILDLFGASEEDWRDWRWQVRHRISKVETLEQIIELTPEEREALVEVGKKYRWAISPYYASLMDPTDHDDPIRWQAVPSCLEYSPAGDLDPMNEELTNPAPAVTRRYPDRLIIKVTNQCAMYCRHCQRRRAIGQVDRHTSRVQLEEALEYVRSNQEIRDVLITGGDALMPNLQVLDWLLTELDNIPHVEIKRIGSRTPVTMPQRITDELCEMLARHHPLYLNTHFNHPKEVTKEAAEACDKLSRAGIPLGNQAVLLNHVNNDVAVMKTLNHELLKIRVKPYYIFHAKGVRGTTHFRCRVEEGLEIMEKLRGYTSGLAIPTYIINAPGGLGKTPILPNYLLSWGKDYVLLRTWEGKVVRYPNYSGETVPEEFEEPEDS